MSLGILAGEAWPERAIAPIYAAAPVGGGGAVSPPATFADIVANARSGIVSVRARVPVPPEGEPVAAAGDSFDAEPDYRNGSGFVVNAAGLIVTSRHVVDVAESVEVWVPQHGRFAALLVGEDVAADLALLRLVDPPADLQALPLGDSDRLRAGDWIVAVGNPYGFAQTVTAGVVSFVGRHLPHSDLAVTSDFVQISAPVNPGSSGGPVLGLDGSVVAVTTKTAVEAQGISFAVPSRTLKWALEAMQRSEDGRVRRGYLGIEFATRAQLDGHGKPLGGAVIVRVVDGAPAHAAGIRRGDVVLTVDGIAVANATVLHEHIVNGAPGSQLAMRVLRGSGVQDSIDAVLSELSHSSPLPTWQ